MNRMKLLPTIVAVLMTLLGLPEKGFAVLDPVVNNWVATDNFNSYLDGALQGQNGGSGWSGGWNAGSHYVVQHSVTYEGAKAVAATDIPDSVQVNRALAVGIKSGIVRFAIRRSVTGGTADWLVGVSFNATGESYPFIRVLSNDIYFGYFGSATGPFPLPLVTNYAADTWYVIHLRFDTQANAFYAREDSQTSWTGPLQTIDGPVGGDVRYFRIVNNGTNSGTFFIDDIHQGSEPQAVPLPMSVAIDIKPGSFPNSINLGTGGTVPVAILSTVTFDATRVDPTTVTLASAPVRLRGRGTPMTALEDVNSDGLLDLVVHVATDALQLSETDTEAILEGQTFEGTSITGVDSVRVVP